MTKTTEVESQFAGIRETAKLLGMSYSAVWESLRRGDFPAPSCQVGSSWRISRVGLQRLIDGDRPGEPTGHAEVVLKEVA